jgi:hypothetical protein|tara:strand:- start:1196 stop:1618 length:423 start_codon:yes stop_codon:yes gene_type:complete
LLALATLRRSRVGSDAPSGASTSKQIRNKKNGKMEIPWNAPLERLLWIRKQTGLNAKEFAKSVGMTAPGFHNMVARSSRVKRVLANSVELIHGIRAEWILTGEGNRRADVRGRLDAAGQTMLDAIETWMQDRITKPKQMP